MLDPTRLSCAARRGGALATSFLVGLAACHDATGPRASTSLIPLGVGTHWVYELTDSVEVGPPYTLPPERIDVRVAADTTIGGERWAVLDGVQHILHDNSAGHYYLTSRADGTYELSAEALAFFPQRPTAAAVRVFKYPVRLGEQGGYPLLPPMWTVSAVDTTIRVPAGEFHCIRYDEGDHVSTFVAPGVGVVQRVSGLAEGRDAEGRLVLRTRLLYRLAAMNLPAPR